MSLTRWLDFGWQETDNTGWRSGNPCFMVAKHLLNCHIQYFIRLTMCLLSQGTKISGQRKQGVSKCQLLLATLARYCKKEMSLRMCRFVRRNQGKESLETQGLLGSLSVSGLKQWDLALKNAIRKQYFVRPLSWEN